jgi:hypothetical protein
MMMPVQAAGFAVGVLLLAVPWPTPSSAQQAAVADPFVQLDAAKLQLGDGKLRGAGELMAEISLDGCEGYVREEVLFQQLLITAALLSGTHYVHAEVARLDFPEQGYHDWLSSERDVFAAQFAQLAGSYLAATTDGPTLDFVRFRLPVVTIEHLADVELYSDPEILRPAAVNWVDEREGLGRGVIAGQARVALVLAAARFYDREQAASSLFEVNARLANGVPLDYAAVLDWLAETASLAANDNEELRQLAIRVDTRLLSLAAAEVDDSFRQRAAERQTANNGEANPSE